MTEHLPYWEGDGITLYHGRCEDILPTLPAESVDALLTDPPYFQVKDEDWDNQWDKSAEFLDWLGSILDQATPLLRRPHSSVWVFASPQLETSVERLVAERFSTLNVVRWVKEAGWHQKAEITALRRFQTPWEGIVFAELRETAPDAFHKEVLSPVSSYFTSERLRAGFNRLPIARALAKAGIYKNVQTGAAMCSDWENGDSLPTPEGYAVLQSVFGSGYYTRSWDSLRAERDRLIADYYNRRRPFTLGTTPGPTTDIWNFDPVSPYPGKHPCEKPQAMLRHMIQTTTRPGATVLDAFAGSGSTLLAARDTGRKAIGIEMDERWCEHAARKLDQYAMDFGDTA